MKRSMILGRWRLSRENRVSAVALALLLLLMPAPVWADEPAPVAPDQCARMVDDGARLTCYDRHFRSANAVRNEVAQGSLPALAQAVSLSTPHSPAQMLKPSILGETHSLTDSNTLSRFWELSPADKHGTFVVKTYLPNFFLPVHYTSNINRAPSSPTYPVSVRNDYKQTEAKFQISLRAKAIEGLLLPNADLWLAYTQRSLWQFWNQKESEPFRSTDFQPEAIYVVPVREGLVDLPGGWHWRMVQLGLGHQSNGQTDPLSRSWNRIYAAAGFERGDFRLGFRINRRTSESGLDDNPGLMRYIGNSEITGAWFPGLATAALTWRTHPAYTERGSLQFDWTYPVLREQPKGLRWYFQMFSGYGETLLDYNHRQTSAGAGVSLFQY